MNIKQVNEIARAYDDYTNSGYYNRVACAAALVRLAFRHNVDLGIAAVEMAQLQDVAFLADTCGNKDARAAFETALGAAACAMLTAAGKRDVSGEDISLVDGKAAEE